MSDDFNFHSYRKWQAASQQLRDQTDDSQSDDSKKSFSEAVQESREGLLINKQEVRKYLGLGNDPKPQPQTPETESIDDWLTEEEAAKLRAFGKYGDKWQRLFTAERYKKKIEEVAAIEAKFRRRLANET
jgi:hypothetical protein